MTPLAAPDIKEVMGIWSVGFAPIKLFTFLRIGS